MRSDSCVWYVLHIARPPLRLLITLIYSISISFFYYFSCILIIHSGICYRQMNVQVRVTYHSCSGSWYVSLFLLSFVLYFRLSLFILFPFLLSCTSFSLLFRPIPRRRCTNTTLKVEVSFKHWTLLNVCFSFLFIFTFSFLFLSYLFFSLFFFFIFLLFYLFFIL